MVSLHPIGGGAAHVARQARNAYGCIVRVEPLYFLNLLKEHSELLVIEGIGGIFTKHYRYITSYKGITLFAKSDEALTLPSEISVIKAKKILIPDGLLGPTGN
jgi:hypothetical protein